MRHYKKDEQGKEMLERTIETHDFFVDGVAPDQKEQLLKYYASVNADIRMEADFGANIHLQLLRENPSARELPRYYPDITNDLSGRKFFIVRPDQYVPEAAAHFILLFALGMLSRYYPDVWIKIIDENVQIAELTDSLLTIVQRKFPNLILDQLTWVKHYVHL